MINSRTRRSSNPPLQCKAHLSRGALESESSKPHRDRAGAITIEVDKVLRATIELDDPVANIEVGQGALCRVGKLGELGRRADDVAVAIDCGAAEKVGDAAWEAVGGDGGFCVGTRLVVEDADGDLRDGRGDCADA